MDSLPDLLEISLPLPASSLEELRQEYLQDSTSAQPIFNYAWGLIRSDMKSEQKQGLFLFHEIYRLHASRRKESLFYIALAEFKLNHLKNAKMYVDNLLAMEPRNAKAQALKKQIEDKLQKDGLIGMAIVSGVVATVSVVAAMIFKRS